MSDITNNGAGNDDLKFGRSAVQKGFATQEQVNEAVAIQVRMQEMGVSARPLEEILVEKGFLDARQVAEIRRVAGLGASHRIPGYMILQKLGKGGMGTVYKARQLSMDRDVAIKVLPPRLAKDQVFVERFLREARAVARLNHENVIGGIDVGEAGGFHYFVMEYVEGEPVSRLLRRERRLSESHGLGIAVQISRALQHAHRHGFVHRDVKPENIMLATNGVAKLCDLGLAKESGADSSLTQTGTSVGTPYYISPEQARGEPDIDIRSDIYSLGASLYHMLTGRPAFEGPTPTVVMTKHVTEAMIPPKKIRPDLSDPASAMIVKCMRKKREDRYQNPEELLEDLERIQEGRPVVHAKPAPPPDRRPSGVHRPIRDPVQRLAPMLGGIAVIALAVAVGIFLLKKGGAGGDNGTGDVDPIVHPVGPTDPTPVTPDPLPVRDAFESEARDRLENIQQWVRQVGKDSGKYKAILDKYDQFTDVYAGTQAGLRGLELRKEFEAFVNQKGEEALAACETRAEEARRQGRLDEARKQYRSFPEDLAYTPAGGKAKDLEKGLKKQIDDRFESDMQLAESQAQRHNFDLAIDICDKVEVYASKPLIEKAGGVRAEFLGRKEQYLRELQEQAGKAYEEFAQGFRDRILEGKRTEARRMAEDLLRRPEMESVSGRVRADVADLAMLEAVEQDLERGLDAHVDQEIELERFRNEQIRLEKKDGKFRVRYLGFENATADVGRLSPRDVEFFVLSVLPAEDGTTWMKLGLHHFFVGVDAADAAGQAFRKAQKAGVKRADLYLSLLGAETEAPAATGDAADLWVQAKRLYQVGQLAEAAEILDRLLRDHAQNPVVVENREQIEDLLAKARGGKPQVSGDELAKLFRGFAKADASTGMIEVVYDFSSPEQMQDWEGRDLVGLRMGGPPGGGPGGRSEWEVIPDEQVLVGAGATEAFWIGRLRGDLQIELDVVPSQERNVGVSFHNNRAGKYYLAGLGMDFGGQVPGLQVPPNSLLRVDLMKGFQADALRILGGTKEPRIEVRQSYHLRIACTDKGVEYQVDDHVVHKGKDNSYREGRISLWLLRSRASFDNIKITGTLDRLWVKEQLSGKRR